MPPFGSYSSTYSLPFTAFGSHETQLMSGPSRSSLWNASSGAWIQERTLAKFFKRVLKLLLCVHNNWSIPCHRLLEWLARYKQEPNTVVSRLNDNFITAVEEHKGTVVSFGRRCGV